MSTPEVCSVCLGYRGSYPKCYKCGMVWGLHPEFTDACDLIVPCTVAASPGPWYTAMLQYKLGGMWHRYAPAIAAVLWRWLDEHWSELSIALGGDPTAVAVVPSSTQSMPTPLYRIAAAQPRLQSLLSNAISYDSSTVNGAWKRHSLEPDAFHVVANAVEGERVLLLEDTWVSGSTPLSAAIAVRRADPEALALVPIARMVYHDDLDGAYGRAAIAPFDFTAYPR